LRIIIPRDRNSVIHTQTSVYAARLTGWYSTFATDTSSGAAVTVICTSCEPHHLRLALRSHRLKQAIYPDHLYRRGVASTCGAGRFSRFLLACAAWRCLQRTLTKNG